MNKKSETTHVFTFPAEGENYTIDIEKLEKPLWLIYSAFRDLKTFEHAGADDTFYRLGVALEGLMYLAQNNTSFGIKFNADRVTLITRALTACAIICDSLDVIKDKK